MKITLQKGIKKSDFNERYVSILKQLHIESIIQKGKIQPIQFAYTEKPTLYDYLLDKHAFLYESQNEDKQGFFNLNNAFSVNNNQGGQFNCFPFRKKANSTAVNAQNRETPDMNASKFRGSNVSRLDISKKGRGSSPANSMLRRQSTTKKSIVQNEKRKTQSDEYVEVSYFNEKQNQRQYFKVCIVPLLLQEPLLAISMEDITFISLYHQRMQQTKQTMTLTSLSYVKLKQKVDSIISQISNDQYKLKKEVLFVSHLVRAFTRIDPTKITFKTFSVSKMIDEIKSLFPCVYRVKYVNESTMPVVVEKKESKDHKKSTNHFRKISSPTSNENYKDNTPGELTQLHITRQNTGMSDNYTQLQLLHQNSSPTKRGREPINGMIFNHLQQISNHQASPTNKESTHIQNQFNHHNVSINMDQYNDIDQVILSHSDAYILDSENPNNNNTLNSNHHMLIKTLLTKKRNSNRNLSQSLPFSQECKTLQRINSLCNFINNYEQAMKEKTLFTCENTPLNKNCGNFSEKDSKERMNSLDTYIGSSRCRLNSNFTNANNNTEESLQEKEKTLTNPQTQTNTIFSNPNKRSQNLTNSQRKFGVISEILGVVEEKGKKESESQLTEDTQIQEFLICNNKSMIYYVLVGVISMFKDKKIELVISLNQYNLYKSIKISISPCIKMTLSRRLTYYQPESVYCLDDIYDLKTSDDPYNFSLLSEKLFSRLNEICLLLGPNKIRQEPDLIEIEFFVDQNKINKEK